MEIGTERCQQQGVLALRQPNALAGPRSEDGRSFQSLPEGERCRQPLANVLSPPRKHAGPSGGRHKRRARNALRGKDRSIVLRQPVQGWLAHVGSFRLWSVTFERWDFGLGQGCSFAILTLLPKC